LIYVIAFATLRKHLPRWQQKYPKRESLNRNYSTWGLLVPLDEFERIADVVISI
jgi:hypothetical protein